VFRSGFQLVPGEAIFTIGSCFARNIENILDSYGFDLPTRAVFNLDDEFRLLGRNVLNNFGTPSILNELSWALDPATPFSEEENFFELFPGKWVDVHLNHTVTPAPLEVVRKRRDAITAIYREAIHCRVMIVTLGLVEVWFDRKSGRYVNSVPRRMMIRREPDRFQLHVLDYEAAARFLFGALEIVQRFCRSDVRVLLTVSPVPLSATYRDTDVMIANTYSKAVLRAAAEEAVARYDFVEYYPSYESIVLSERSAAWTDDQIHPTQAAIDLNCSRMIAAYSAMPDTLPSAEALRARIALEERPQKIFGILFPHRDLLETCPDLATACCKAALRSGRAAEARGLLDFTGDTIPKEERAILEARILLAVGEAAAAEKLLAAPPHARQLRRQYFVVLAQVCAQTGNLDNQPNAAREWAAFNPDVAEPFRLLAVAHSRAGLIDRADNYFRQALERAEDRPNVVLDYAEHLEKTGRRAEAEKLIEFIDPQAPSHLRRLERLRADLG
jgi:hypothetical protein